MLATLVNHWLGKFESALHRGDGAALRDLFHADCHWRDLLALTWDIRTVSGVDAVVSQLLELGAAHSFRTDPDRTARSRAHRHDR